jgi:hypothetical protein
MADLNSMEFKANLDLENDKNMMALGVIKRRMRKEEKLRVKEGTEAGKESNIPKFIADSPWYISQGSTPSLSHQKYFHPFNFSYNKTKPTIRSLWYETE